MERISNNKSDINIQPMLNFIYLLVRLLLLANIYLLYITIPAVDKEFVRNKSIMWKEYALTFSSLYFLLFVNLYWSIFNINSTRRV